MTKSIVTGYSFAFWVELLFLIAVITMIQEGQGGMRIPGIYKVAGLEAMDEAIGRCTEMGKPVHFSPGIGDLQNRSDARRHVYPRIRGQAVALVMIRISSPPTGTSSSTLSEEIVKQSYAGVGKKRTASSPITSAGSRTTSSPTQPALPESCSAEKPAANILVGAFWAESLIFAEVGSIAGAIQISGYCQHPPDPRSS